MNRKHKLQQGMTLIEMLVVIVLIGMMTGWSLHSWRGYQQALQLEQSAQRLLAFLSREQVNANWYNRSVTLWATTGPGGCVGTSTIGVASCSTNTNGQFRLDAAISLVDFSHDMGFFGLRNAAQSGHITLSNTAGRLRVILSPRGRLRICSEKHPVLSTPLC